MKTQAASRNTRSLPFTSLIAFVAVFALSASQAYAGATPHMTPMHSGLVSLASGQTIRLNVTLHPELIGASQGLPLTLTFDVYEVPLVGAETTMANVVRVATHRSVHVTLGAGQAAFFDYTVPRDNAGQLVGASVSLDDPNLGALLPAVMPTLEGRTATGQSMFVLPGQACGFQEVENRPAPSR